MSVDAEIIARARQGDRNAAADLIDGHAALVYSVCLGLLADPDQAQDAAQDVLLKGISRLASLRTTASFRSWLVSIAYNQCRDHWKQTRRRRELLDRELIGIDASVAQVGAAPIPGMGTGPATPLPTEDSDLEQALARLPENHRIPLLLYYFDGLSTQRVAEALDISPNGAASRLCRARRALREILEVDHA